MFLRNVFLILFFWLFVGISPGVSETIVDREAHKIVKDAVDYWRDQSSRTLAQMKVHRANYQRSFRLLSWTEGSDRALVRFISPAKDAGNATLTLDDDTWTFTPKTNRVIKIPASMKSQSWMGSDFSYQDLSKDDDIIDRYTHRILSRSEIDGRQVTVVESIPHDDAPIVWGKEVLKIRSDRIILEHEFYDQDMKLVKKLTARDIKLLGGKLYPGIVRMKRMDIEEKWTEVIHEEVEFGLELPSSFFSLSNLRNPR